VRFEAALDRMARSPQNSWTEVAHQFGYYDQMHMVHDFSRFSGETPTRTMQHFEAAFDRQMTAIRSGRAPPSEGERWVLPPVRSRIDLDDPAFRAGVACDRPVRLGAPDMPNLFALMIKGVRSWDRRRQASGQR
jgi:AraC-like DNA-binding protein